ncbi:hypothetical protein [Hymenobacter negativus]|uniref:Metalloprotease n=1 Tax=Hymenobacter negativus TaxID=2795026 RepID=A0ABS3QB89_9BACT|nr:hypothetical protein [Hymenobacter negativus]MBO2008376.1 hypothetical protein [Hymenobacter negativus]
MKPLFSTLLALATSAAPLAASAQLAQATPVDTVTARAALLASTRQYPKFYRALCTVQQQHTLLRKLVLVRNGRNDGPAAAFPNGVVRLDVRYLESPQPGFDDNRMVVVFYHEIGHLHYFRTVPVARRTADANERAAFDYSLQMTQHLADAGDCGPLQAGLRFMLLRSQSSNLADPHVRALQSLVQEPAYADYRRYVAQHCPPGPTGF